MKLLNLGCGSRFCSEPCWTNLDIYSVSDQVTSHNLIKGLPFPDETFDAVYHSHFLEHLTKEDGFQLSKECFRVLKSRVVVRVVVPDLEQICRIYLETLEKVEDGEREWQDRYDWITLEMYDQAIRTVPGGEMLKYLRQAEIPDKEFIISRVGNKAIQKIIEYPQYSLSEYILNWKLWKKSKIIKLPEKIRRFIITNLFLNEVERKALQIGLLRVGGEIHQWMYDQHSLALLLREIGFREICKFSAAESKIPEWNTYFLDIDSDGSHHAPSSLYMEGVKP